MTQEPPLLTAGEVAAMFNVTGETVRRWARTGKLTAYRYPSGRIRFRPADVEAMLSTPVEVAS